MQDLLRGGGNRVHELLNPKHLGACLHSSLKKHRCCYLAGAWSQLNHEHLTSSLFPTLSSSSQQGHWSKVVALHLDCTTKSSGKFLKGVDPQASLPWFLTSLVWKRPRHQCFFKVPLVNLICNQSWEPLFYLIFSPVSSSKTL